MPLKPLEASFGMSWMNLDAWSETYVGVFRLVYEILPDDPAAQESKDGALCQLALVGSNHLVEVTVGKLLKPFTGQVKGLSQESYDRLGYKHAMLTIIERATSKKLDLSEEPFLSSECLRERRNATVHKQSAVANVNMARAALFTGVEATKALYQHFDVGFPYSKILNQYPMRPATMFSKVWCPG
jgi:hypothetical protein